MKSNIVLVFVLWLTTALVGVSQTRFVEKVERKEDELVIAYEKYVLENGLTLLIHEDHSDPMVYVDVTYHVGSAVEQPGRSGFAHFFEHMMFQGSEHVGDEQHFKIITESGGDLNGSTSADRTNYWEVLPANQLEVAFWLESDRMGFFLDSVTQQKFEVQRATVKNERAQRYDNRPYGLVWEKMDAAMYPPTHPYAWQTIGYVEDLDRVNVNDLKKFFLRWYGPNNATLTVAGDVDSKEVIRLAEKYFAIIPKGPEVLKQEVKPVVLTSDRYISYEDNIRSPQVTFAYPAVPSRHEDEAALDILSDILSGGKSSLFYQHFIKSQKAQYAFTYNPTQELAGEFIVLVRTFPGNSLSEMDSLVRQVFLAFEERGVTDNDIEKYKASFESEIIHSLSSVKGKGAMLAAYQTFTQNPNYLKTEIEQYMGVTKEDVMRVYNTYIKNKHAVILSVVPKGDSLNVAAPNNFVLPHRDTIAEEAAEYKNLTYQRIKDTLNRFVKPVAPAAPLVRPPAYWTHKFDNGLEVIGAKNKEVPSVAIQINIAAGHRYEALNKIGTAELLASMLNESTKKYTVEQLDELLEGLGSSVSVGHYGEDIVLYVNSLTKNIDATLAIAEQVLFYPRFDKEEFERVKKLQLAAIENRVTKAPEIARNVYAKLLYGPGHIMGEPLLGNAESLEQISLKDVKKYYQTRFSPTVSSVVIVGDIDKDSVLAKLNFLKTWKSKEVKSYQEKATPSIDKTKIYFVNKENAPQSEIKIGYMALPYDATGNYYKAALMNYVLGGAFNSRINLNLRELHSYTYGARSGFYGGKYAGTYTASASVRADATDSSVVEFMKEIEKYATEGITEEELLFTKQSIGQREALKYETAGQKAGFIKRILVYNLAANYVEEQNSIVDKLTVEEINELAKRYLPYDNMIILVVGDKKVVFDDLLKLGYEVVELDVDGNKLK